MSLESRWPGCSTVGACLQFVTRMFSCSHVQALRALTLTAAVLLLDGGSASALTLDIRTTASSDDAEEFANGTMYLNSGDLELIHDTSDQMVGMRWLGITIPPGATITAAWLQFAAKEAHTVATSLTIRAQASANPSTFSLTARDISLRPLTSASTGWAPVAWAIGEAGANQRTPDLGAILQEVIARPGWVSGGALAMVITGTGHRTAWAWDGNKLAAPLLHVEYTTGPPPENPPVARLAVAQVPNPALTVTADGAASTDTDLTPIASYRFDFGDGTPPVVTLAPSATATHTYALAGAYTVTLIVTDTGLNASVPATGVITLAPTSGVTVTLERRTAASADDAEEFTNGTMYLKSGDLELIHDASDQTVGMRWPALPIPTGATITAAWLQFAAKESQAEPTNLVIRAQASDNPPAFSLTARDLSSRARTSATATWIPPAWAVGEAGSNQRTPDVSAVLQEVVSRPGWVSGNALALIITGTGHRTAHAWDGNKLAAPLLHIEYSTGPPPENPPVARLTVVQAPDPALTVNASGAASTDVDVTPIVSYAFDFGDGTPVVTTAAPIATAAHSYAIAGTYTVTLIVTDTGLYASTPVTATIAVRAVGGPPIAVHTGYYDTHHPDRPRPKPDPWSESPGVVFVGVPDTPTGGWDSSCLRVDNLSGTTLSGVVVTVDIAANHYTHWATNSIPANGQLILAQTAFENFDGSDTNPAGCFGCDPAECLTRIQSTVPVVHVTIGGITTDYFDTGQILNTHGVDAAGCPGTPGRLDESESWTRIFPAAPGAPAPAANAAGWRGAATHPTGPMSLALPYPNPAHGELVLRFSTAVLGPVQLGLYDVAGRLVRQLVQNHFEPGEYRKVLDVRGVPAGVYFCRLQTPAGTIHRALVLAP